MKMNFIGKVLYYAAGIITSLFLSMNTGCVSGGFKLTRQYAGWVNSQTLVLRVIIYLLTFVVFGVTLLIDSVVFNTMDFWQGKVSAGGYEFKDGDKTYLVQHSFKPGTQYRQTEILSYKNDQKESQVQIAENQDGSISVYRDGILDTKVDNISELPRVSHFNKEGALISENSILSSAGI